VSFVDRKNYRLQDIQLSKITRGHKPRGKLLAAAGFVPPDPLGSFARGDPFAPRRSLALSPGLPPDPVGQRLSLAVLTPRSLRFARSPVGAHRVARDLNLVPASATRYRRRWACQP
jgi:hypothetical protein